MSNFKCYQVLSLGLSHEFIAPNLRALITYIKDVSVLWPDDANLDR